MGGEAELAEGFPVLTPVSDGEELWEPATILPGKGGPDELLCGDGGLDEAAGLPFVVGYGEDDKATIVTSEDGCPGREESLNLWVVGMPDSLNHFLLLLPLWPCELPDR